MSSSPPAGVSDQALTIQRLGPRLHRIEPLFDHDEFTLFEVDGDFRSEQQLLAKLINYGALETCGTEYDRGTKRTRYRWVDGATEQFRAYLETVTELPCGHRVHIYNPPGSPSDELGCKYCARGDDPPNDEGDTPPYPKAIVRDRLNADGGASADD